MSDTSLSFAYLGDEADAVRATEAVADAVDEAADSVERASRSMSENLDDVQDAVRRVERSVDDVDDALDRIDGRDVNVDVNVDTDRDRAGILGRAAGLGAAAGASMLSGIAGVLPFGIGEAVAAAGPEVAIAVGALALIIGLGLAGMIAAAIPAAVATLAGGGILGMGLIGAAQDPRVVTAWGLVATKGKEVLTTFASPFVAPLTRGAELVSGMLTRIEPALSRMGNAIAPLLDKLFPAMIGAVEEVVPSIEELVWASVPMLEKLIPLIPMAAEHLVQILDQLVALAPQGQLFVNILVNDIMPVTLDILVNLVTIVGWLAKLFEFGWERLVSSIDNAKLAFELIGDAAGAVANVVEVGWHKLISIISGGADRIRALGSSMWSGLTSGFRNAINWIVGGWNRLSFRVPSVDIPIIGRVGGFTINTPDIPYLASGGVVQAAGLAHIVERAPEAVYLPAGAAVRPLSPSERNGSAGGEHRVVLELRGSREVVEFVKAMIAEFYGGDVDVALSTP